jgi:hypothetical protein
MYTGDDFELIESTWEEEYEAAQDDAELYGLGFFVVFQDGNIGRVTMPEVCDIVDEWKSKVALS